MTTYQLIARILRDFTALINLIQTYPLSVSSNLAQPLREAYSHISHIAVLVILLDNPYTPTKET
jgi:hypothetical protein